LRHLRLGYHLVVLLGVLLPVPLAAQAPVSWVQRHSTFERTIARLTEATSSSERVRHIERLARLGPPERVASALASALAVELEPQVRQALVHASIRVAALDAPAAVVLAPIAIQRFGEGRSAEDRAPWARLLGLLGTTEAIDALIAHRGEAAVAEALVTARATDPLLAELGTEAERDTVVPLLGRIGDARAVEPLFGLARTEVGVSAFEALASIAFAVGEPILTSRVRDAIAEALLVNEDALRLVRLFDALARTGALEDAARPLAIEAHLSDAEPTVREAALRCAAALDPGWAAAFAATLAPSDARVLSLLPMSDAPILVPHATALATSPATDGMRDAALDFLVRARDGAGIDALIALDAPPLVIAVASRRWSSGPGPSDHPLAEGPLFFPRADDDRASRLRAAIALASAAEVPSGPLVAWVEREPDRGVRAWLLEAVRRHHVALDARLLLAALLDADLEHVEIAAILVVPWAAGPSHDRRALRGVLSRLLRLGAPSQVAAAVWSLSMMGAREASAAIEALLDHHHASVRIAAAGALRILRPERVRYLRARAAVDPDPRAARVLSEPISEPSAYPLDVLFLDVTTTEVEASAPWLEVQTDDGLLRQLPVAPDGTFALIDVPGRSAEVRLLLRDRVRR
jgi:hypothetical protein